MPINRRQFLKTGLIASAATTLGAGSAAASTNKDVTNGPRSKPQIALTLHGQGDPAIVGKLLDILKSTSTPISVFAIGTWLQGFPTVAKQMLDAGYDIGNHTMHHYQM